MPNDTREAAAPARRLHARRLVFDLADAVVPIALAATLAEALLEFLSAFVVSGGPFGYAAWVEDDFFYYAVIARNIVETGQSTFDGATLTNGYHPLWMAVCVAVAGIFDIHSTAYFMTIYLIQATLVVGGVVAFARLTAKAEGEGLMSRGARLAATVAYGLAFALIGMRGMEIALLALLTPLLLLSIWGLCERPTLRRAFAASGLLCATILSRLDAALVFAPVCLATAIYILRGRGLRQGLALAPAVLAFIPLAVYLAGNYLVFGAAFPLSGLAKRLMVEGASFALSGPALNSFVSISNANFMFVPLGVTIASLGGLAVALAARPIRSSVGGAGFILVSLGAMAFFLQTMITSDWRLWVWYFFALALTGPIGVALLFDALMSKGSETVSKTAALVLCAVLTLLVLKANAWTLRTPASQSNALFLRALPISEFAKAHPGRYAMGDGAGAPGFVLPGGLVQLEGLVNDAAMLNDIRQGGSLEASLERQGVDYYITSEPPLRAGCVTLKEPRQGGARVSRLSENVCEAPVMTDRTGYIDTQIWDVRDGLN